MLSYRHSYHAGNYADLLKHLIQIEILSYLVQKPTGFSYIDTHAGAGMYQLTAAQAQKTLEYQQGVGRWFGDNALALDEWPEMKEYLQLVQSFNPKGPLSCYPGSPLIANSYLREQDNAWLFELHSTDYPLLQKSVGRQRKIRARQEDGYQGLLSLLPTPTRRALVLIDPSYEQKDDYQKVVKTIAKAHKKMANTLFALWYPVVDRAQISRLEKELKATGIEKIQLFELGLGADSEGRGMTSAGMIVINPPWTLYERMQTLLPRLAAALSEDGKPHWRCEVLAAES